MYNVVVTLSILRNFASNPWTDHVISLHCYYLNRDRYIFRSAGVPGFLPDLSYLGLGEPHRIRTTAVVDNYRVFLNSVEDVLHIRSTCATRTKVCFPYKCPSVDSSLGLSPYRGTALSLDVFRTNLQSTKYSVLLTPTNKNAD